MGRSVTNIQSKTTSKLYSSLMSLFLPEPPNDGTQADQPTSALLLHLSSVQHHLAVWFSSTSTLYVPALGEAFCWAKGENHSNNTCPCPKEATVYRETAMEAGVCRTDPPVLGAVPSGSQELRALCSCLVFSNSLFVPNWAACFRAGSLSYFLSPHHRTPVHRKC